MYCNTVGVAATVADQYISAGGGWFVFTPAAAVTTLHCIATGGSTTANGQGGSGLPAGIGSGSGGSGGSGTSSNFAAAFPAAGTAAGFNDGTNMVGGRATATALADGFTPPTAGLQQGQSFPMWYNGATFDRAPGDATNGAYVQIKAGNISGFATSALQTTQNTNITAINTILGTQADAVCGSATGTCTMTALAKYLNNAVNSPPPLNVNTVNTAWTGLTPNATTPSQTGTIIAANVDTSSVAGIALGVPTNFGTTPGAVKVAGVNASLFMGTAIISATNGIYSNCLIGNVACDANSGNKGAQTQRTVLATDQLALAAWGHGATGAAVPAGATYQGGNAVSAEPAKATTGNMAGATFDLAGKAVTSPYAMRELFLNCAVTITNTSQTTCTGMATQGASVKIYITNLCITRNDAGTTAVSATLNDSATTIYDVPNNGGGGGICPPLPVPLQIAANTDFKVTMSGSITSMHISASGFKGY